MSRPGPSRRVRGLASGALALASVWLLGPGRAAADVATSLPHAVWLGAPRGAATARDVDASGARHAGSLPAPESARIGWQRRLAAGATGNVLVDAAGRVFVPGVRRMTELGADGSLRHEIEAPASASVAAALLADGTRVVLTREGQLLGWSDAGASALHADLPTPPPSSDSALVPLADGGLLVAVGRWLFAFDASRGSPLYTSLPAAIALVRQVGARTLLVDERGRLFEWRRGHEPRLTGELSAPVTAALADGSLLVALTSNRTLETLDPASGRTSELARFDAPGPLPLIARAEPGVWLGLGPEGDWLRLGATFSPNASRLPARRDGGTVRDARLLVDSQGGAVFWAANRPLLLAGAQGSERAVADVRCADPIDLVPAGAGRLVAACGSGSIWLIDGGPPPAAAR
jgi:hypothetical protein